MNSDAAGTTAFRFVRDDVRSHDGMAMWREVIGRTLARLDLSVLPDRPFHSEALIENLPEDVGFGIAVSSGIRMERTRDLVTDADDDVVLYFSTSGSLVASQFGREAVLGRGDALLLSHAETGSIATSSFARSVMVRLPRQALAPLVPDLDDMFMRPLPKENEALWLLVNYVGGLAGGRALAEPELQRLVAGHVRDLMAVTLGASRTRKPMPNAAEFAPRVSRRSRPKSSTDWARTTSRSRRLPPITA